MGRRGEAEGTNRNPSGMWAVLQNRIPFGGRFIRVPYHIGDLKRDLNLEIFLC